MNDSQKVFLKSFFCEGILNQPGYAIDRTPAPIKLDQNESPSDWPSNLKDRILRTLASLPWNRYPEPFDEELSSAIAQYAGVPNADWVLTGPGSNYLIALCLQHLTKKLEEKPIVAFPSFPLYESCLKGEAIDYQRWELDDHFQYKLELLPKTSKRNILIFASPNNPVGNSLRLDELRDILISHPKLLVIADEAYVEFSDRPYTELLQEFSNLILIRTFSKTISAAGVRIGYLLAHPDLVHELKKMRLPYLLNKFSLVAAKEILNDHSCTEMFKRNIQTVKTEREKIQNFLKTNSSKINFTFVPSDANFILLRFPSSTFSSEFYRNLLKAGILVRNIDKHPGTSGCLRISIGTEKENQELLNFLNS